MSARYGRHPIARERPEDERVRDDLAWSAVAPWLDVGVLQAIEGWIARVERRACIAEQGPGAILVPGKKLWEPVRPPHR